MQTELLRELPQIIQNGWWQFATRIGINVHTDDGVKQLVSLLEHLCAFIFVVLYRLPTEHEIQ